MDTVADPDILRRLDALDEKLDRVLERQRFVEDLFAEWIPVVREVLTSSSVHLARMEDRGWFRLGAELATALDHAAATTSPEDVRALAAHVGPLVSTLRRVSEPEILALADEATAVLTHTEEVRPIGVMGAVRATSDADVQRGLGVALEVLRHLGRHQATTPKAAAPPSAPASPRPSAPAAAPAATPAPAAPVVAPRPLVPPPSATVTWEGRAFDAQGFLLDPGAWDEALCTKMAAALGMSLTDEHWAVIRWIRSEYAASGASPNVRRTATGTGVGTKRMYELFPKTPGKTAAMLAGVPKPVGCV